MSFVEVLMWPLVFFCGACFGFVLGVRYQHHKLTREVAVRTQEIKSWYHKRWPALVGAFCALMAFLTWLSAHNSGNAVEETRQQAACVTTYANRLYDSLAPRQKATERLQEADKRFKQADQVFADALEKLLADSLRGQATQETRLHDAVVLQHATEAKAAALRHANHVAGRLAKARSQNPYPPPPKEVCPRD